MFKREHQNKVLPFIQIQNSKRVPRGRQIITVQYHTVGQASHRQPFKSSRLWSSLPSDIKDISDFKKFTSRIKLWLKANQN